jgi:hypothetical protein
MIEHANPEVEVIARIERLEMELRDARRRIEHARTPADKRVLNQQMAETLAQIQALRRQLQS